MVHFCICRRTVCGNRSRGSAVRRTSRDAHSTPALTRPALWTQQSRSSVLNYGSVVNDGLQKLCVYTDELIVVRKDVADKDVNKAAWEAMRRIIGQLEY